VKAKSGRKSKKESPTPLLRKWQRNDLFEAIQAVGLDPRDFDLAIPAPKFKSNTSGLSQFLLSAAGQGTTSDAT
jgi:hypothetical protein